MNAIPNSPPWIMWRFITHPVPHISRTVGRIENSRTPSESSSNSTHHRWPLYYIDWRDVPLKGARCNMVGPSNSVWKTTLMWVHSNRRITTKQSIAATRALRHRAHCQIPLPDICVDGTWDCQGLVNWVRRRGVYLSFAWVLTILLLTPFNCASRRSIHDIGHSFHVEFDENYNGAIGLVMRYMVRVIFHSSEH